jgi:hypothetical protein
MKHNLLFIAAAMMGILIVACGTNTQKANNTTAPESVKVIKTTDTVLVFIGMNSKGVGRFKNVQINNPLDPGMVSKGRMIYQSKCLSCHKLTTEMLVGPGWAGVTERRTPEWIMNWITNTQVMLNKDLAARTDLVRCLIRMPNQDLTDVQARNVLEFMRQNDGEK